ncbi:MAG: response regulator [bacterium]
MTVHSWKTLLVEDNEADAVLLSEMLGGTDVGHFELVRTVRAADAINRLKLGVFDAILLDLTLPDSRGFETLQNIQDAAGHTPIIILTGVEDESMAIGAIRHGAQDYLVKGTVDGRAIARAIRYAIDRQKTEEALRQSDAAYASAKVSVDTVNAMEEGVALISMNGNVSSVNPALSRLTGYAKAQLEGRSMAELLPLIVHERDVQPAIDALRTAMRGEIPAMAEATVVSNPAGHVPVVPRIAFIRDEAGRPTKIVLTVQDMTEDRKAEQKSQIVTTILALFARETARREYLDAVARVIRQWSGYRCIGIRVLNDRGEAPYETYFGFSDAFIQSETALKIASLDCACTRVLARQPGPNDMKYFTSGGSFCCGNTGQLQDSPSAGNRERYRGICAAHGLASVAIIPIRHHNTIIGTIHFADEKEGAMAAEAVEFVETTLSPIIGEAICRFNVESELRSLASRITLAEERARRQLAMALHDTVGQSLALGKIKLGALRQMINGKEAQEILREIREMFEAAVEQTRTLSFELSPPILYELGLGAAMEWLGEDFSKRHGFTARLIGTDKEHQLEESMSVLFFQSARELLTNVAKHAGADDVEISLAAVDGYLIMKIVDNGKGMEAMAFENAIATKNSLGLFSIRERMKQIGGSFSLKSAPGHGTTVVLTAPIQQAPGPDFGIRN